ncbi:hypothetical protein CLV43_12522 [Umezawaea tangerina]|uniref:Uncharacterized protein n=1 Tax=Umezawaea tangerina TaxID=84725 RepID=A0A2T0S8N6_9PSEU|nr:hypothetical protein CLV43_12522 [Umezawaea tangerina]
MSAGQDFALPEPEFHAGPLSTGKGQGRGHATAA